MWKHHLSCVANPEGVKSDGPTRNSRLLLPIPKSVSRQFNEGVVVKMRDDVIGRKAKTDPLIQEFGQRRFDKSGKYEHTHAYIACRMRELARLVLAVKRSNLSLDTLTKCINPTLWSTLLTAIKEEAGFNIEDKTFSSPSFAQKVGHSLKKCASIMKIQAAEDNDNVTVERMKIFLEMYKDEYDARISSLARDSLSTAQYNNTKFLPLVEDVVKLSKYLDQQVSAIIKMDPKDTEYQYSSLCKLILAQVILFNRKRSGEAERLKIDAFLRCSLNNEVDAEVGRSLTKFEQHLCQTHLRVETRGKRGRKVAVLFTNTMKKNIEVLLKLKNELKIKSNDVFCRPHGTRPFRGNDVLKEAAINAKLQYVDRITSTSLRKQLATMCQVLNLAENSQDILARFMGHDIRIHRQYYRLPQSTLEVAKVSKALHLLNSGKIGNMAGADLEDINVQEPIDIETSDADDEEENMAEKQSRITTTNDPVCTGHTRVPLIIADCDDDARDPDWVPKRRKIVQDGSTDDTDMEQEHSGCRRITKRKGMCVKRAWSNDERTIVLAAFQKNIQLSKLPGKVECERLIKKNSILQKRSWRNIKDFVRHQMLKTEKSLKKK